MLACLQVALRFMILFMALVAVQFLALHFVDGFQRIYAPFDFVVKPLVRRHYGAGEGSLGPVILWANLLGISIYSSLLAFVGALFKRRSGGCS